MRYERSLAVTKRLDDLVGLIRRSSSSASLIAVKLRVSEQTVYRDIRFLKRQGFKIRSIKVSAKWAYQLEAEGTVRAVRDRGRRK